MVERKTVWAPPVMISVVMVTALLSGASAFAGDYGTQKVAAETEWKAANCKRPEKIPFDPVKDIKDSKTFDAFRLRLDAYGNGMNEYLKCVEAEARVDNDLMRESINAQLLKEQESVSAEIGDISKAVTARVNEVNAKNAPKPKPTKEPKQKK